MKDWFLMLSFTEQIYWGIALISTIIFFIILIFTFIGGDADTDTDLDSDTGVGFQFFTFKNMIAFFTIFGWVGIACINEGLQPLPTVLISTFCGLLMMFIMAALFYYISKMTQSGTLNYNNAKNAIGEVYLEIGKNRSRMGKVQVKVQGALREMDALTETHENLKQGTVIQVESVTENGILIVKPI